ncbi:protein eva-1 homolog C isoform X2 [Salarias fasciatus]|uniref:protein eva-1 homolog C isoform X2 n=1 Tax=Salarias fasciatus TaxID=181472 RepID=UPI001176D5A2|nr:protein eva-1 homolog C-like isoform X2 [Salarias fasciatus]
MTEPWSVCRSFCLLSLLLVLKTRAAHSAPDFTLYLHTILKNHTAHACEGETLAIECPSRTSVAVLSAFYGRRVPSQHLCPSAGTNSTVEEEEDTECTSPVAIEKVLSECQDKRSCHIPVLSPVFGQDPCPLTSKYLLVSYKCRPEHHRTRLVCENERLRLMCKNETVLAIYSATFGHLLHGSPHCPQDLGPQTDMECLSPLALRKVSRRCHGRSNCSVLADTQTFGDPCFPGTRKHLRVSFTCVPRYLLEDVGRGSTDPFLISDYTHGGWYTGPTYRPQNVLFTNSLEIIEKMLGLPERVALYFVSGICAGLVFLLCLFGVRSTVVRDVKDLVSDLSEELKAARRNRNELMEDLYDDEVSDTSSFRRLTQSYRTTDILSPSTLAVEMVDCQGEQTRRDLPNGDMWPHRDSSPYAIHKIQTYSN